MASKYDPILDEVRQSDMDGMGAAEAPVDGKQYARKNAAWAEVATGDASVVTLTPADGVATIDFAAGNRFVLPAPSGAVELATDNEADMKELILDINSGADLVSYPATWYWKGAIPALECYGINRIKLKSATYDSAVRLIAESDFAYRYPNGNDSYTKILVNFEGDTFTDESSTAATITNTGTVTRDTTNKKFGRGSGTFSGTNYLSLAHIAGYSIGTGSGTLECWVKTTQSGTDYRGIIGQQGDVMTLMLMSAGTVTFYDGAIPHNGAIAINDGNWHHVAWVKNSGTSYIYIDGVQDITWSDAVNYVSPANFTIGNEINNGGLVGNIDCVRYSVGIARYTEPFTPSTIPFQ